MNFSTSLGIQPSWNDPRAYYSTSNPFVQPPHNISASRLNPLESLRQAQEELYNQTWNEEDNIQSYQPVKKVKSSKSPEPNIRPGHGQNMLPNRYQINETIKNKDITSSHNNGFRHEINYFNERINTNHRQGTNQDLKPQKPIISKDAEFNVSTNLRAFPAYDSPQKMMHLMQFNSLSAREQLIQRSQALAHQQAAAQIPAELQRNLFQNFQQQIASSQKAYGQLLLNNMNPMMRNSIYFNPQTLNALKQAQVEQRQRNLLQNAQNRILLQQEAQKRCEELNLPKNESAQIETVEETETKKVDLGDMDEFPDIAFDDSMFPDFDFLGDGLFDYNFEQEELKIKGNEDLDDKKTAETSATNTAEIPFNEFYEAQINEFFPPSHVVEEFSGKKSLSNNKVSVGALNKKQQRSEDETNLKKRSLDFIEKEEKAATQINSDSQVQEKRKRGRPRKLPLQPNQIQSGTVEGIIMPDSQYSTFIMKEDQTMTYTEQTQSSPGSGTTISVTRYGKTKPAKIKPTNVNNEETRPFNRDRRMNKLQSLRAARETYLEELKKPYEIKLHTDPNNSGEKVAQTRVGQGFQANVELHVNNGLRQRKPRLVKSVWNPSSLEDGRLEEFYYQLKEIFGQDVKSEEGALKLLRGTGMDVDGTVDIVRRNASYFKYMLFPEPKPTKTSRI